MTTLPRKNKFHELLHQHLIEHFGLAEDFKPETPLDKDFNASYLEYNNAAKNKTQFPLNTHCQFSAEMVAGAYNEEFRNVKKLKCLEAYFNRFPDEVRRLTRSDWENKRDRTIHIGYGLLKAK